MCQTLHNDTNAVWFNQTCYNTTFLADNSTYEWLYNATAKRVSASEEYFK